MKNAHLAMFFAAMRKLYYCKISPFFTKVQKRAAILFKNPLFYCFLAPFALMLGIYALIGVFPFGNNSVLVLDLNGQYVYFFEALRDAIWGDSSLLYSFSRALGGEFLGIYAYYLASPFSYLVALFPKSMITEALLLMILTKCGLCGLSFGVLLKRKAKICNTSSVIFSCLYALCGYVVVMQHNTMWIDNIFLLPWIILGVDALLLEKKYKLFVFSLSYAIISNYYIGYMTCIFVLLYFFYSYFSQPRERINPSKRRFHFFAALTRIAFFSAISILISSIIIIPSYYSLTFGKMTFSDPDFSFFSRFDFFELLTKFLFGSYDTVRPSGLPNVYCGIITLFLIPYYYFNDKISIREKIADTFICLIFVFSFSLNTVDMVWHGFQAPNWLNYRYAYMLVFFLAYMAARGFQGMRRMSSKIAFFTACFIVLLIILSYELGYEHVNLLWTALASFACVIVYYVVLSSIFKCSHRTDKFASSLLLGFVCLEMLLGGLANTLLLDADVVISSRTSYRDYMEKWENAFEYAKNKEDIFCRMEKISHRRVNDSYAFGYRGLSGSSSTLNEDTVTFLNKMGYVSSSHSSEYTGSTPVADMILGVRYIACEKRIELSQHYNRIYSDNEVSLYENPYALSIAFAVNDSIKNATFINSQDSDKTLIDFDTPFRRLNKLVGAMLGEKEIELYKAVPHKFTKDNSRETTSRNHILPIDETVDSFANYTVSGVGDSDIYAFFPTFYYTDAKMLINGEEKGNYFSKSSTGYIYVGRYSQEEQATISFKLNTDGIYLHKHVPYFFYLDSEIFSDVYNKLSERQFFIDECKEHYFSGRITTREGFETVFTTIPYDKGWHVFANGEKLECYEVLDSLLAFDLDAGVYELEMLYMPKEYIVGALLSCAGILIFAVVIFVEHRHKKISKSKE